MVSPSASYFLVAKSNQKPPGLRIRVGTMTARGKCLGELRPGPRDMQYLFY